MTAFEADHPAQMPARQLQFDRYVLDLDRGCLLLDGKEIELRPKTFAVLQHLVQNPRRLVSKEELFAAVWSNLVVTDDALVQSIGELRRALGDDGQRLIRTVPRRGYRLECDVAAPAQAPAPADAPGHATSDPVRGAVPPSAPHRRLRARAVIILTISVLVAGALLLSYFATERSADTPAETREKAAIAVLPLWNQSDDPRQEYFADGLAQDIINALGRFPELTVLSWNAVSAYKNQPASPGEISRRLAVHYQVEGSVLRSSDRVRVNVQLVNAEGRVLWSSRYDEALADLFALEDKITVEIAGALAIRVTRIEQQKVSGKPAESLEAYDYVLRARPALQRPTRANNAEARALLRRAIKIDPNSAAAYSALAETYHISVAMGWAESPREFLSRSEEMANKALSLDPSQVRAQVTLGRIHLFHDRHDQAIAELERAVKANPSDSYALAGHGNVLMWLGRTDAAVEALERAQRIDPELNPIDRFALSLAYYLKRRYAAAVEQAELNLRENAGANFSRIVLVASYAQLNRLEDAARIAQEVRRLDRAFDPGTFGNKFLKPQDLQHLRDGFRKAGLLTETGNTALGK
jgi:TolB-like protein/DNA-binding winged helix-turn-helix (wHTH) protein/Tfp pilus assembly protein PilF